MKKLFTDERVKEKVSFVINGLTINGLVPTYCSNLIPELLIILLQLSLKQTVGLRSSH